MRTKRHHILPKKWTRSQSSKFEVSIFELTRRPAQNRLPKAVDVALRGSAEGQRPARWPSVRPPGQRLHKSPVGPAVHWMTPKTKKVKVEKLDQQLNQKNVEKKTEMFEPKMEEVVFVGTFFFGDQNKKLSAEGRPSPCQAIPQCHGGSVGNSPAAGPIMDW